MQQFIMFLVIKTNICLYFALLYLLELMCLQYVTNLLSNKSNTTTQTLKDIYHKTYQIEILHPYILVLCLIKT